MDVKSLGGTQSRGQRDVVPEEMHESPVAVFRVWVYTSTGHHVCRVIGCQQNKIVVDTN